MTLNIWYFNHYAGGPGVGQYSRAFYLAREWQAAGHTCSILVARNHHLLDFNPLPEEMTVQGVRYVSLEAPPYRGNGLDRLMNMASFCSASFVARPTLARPDVIITSSPHPFGIFPAWFLARRYGAKLAFEVRDLWPLSLTELMGLRKLHPLVLASSIAERFAYSRSDLVISLLGAAEEYMVAKGLKPDRFVYAPNGIASATSSLDPVSENGQQAKGQIERWKRDGRVVVIHAGSQGAHNALDRLLHAMGELKNRNKDFGLLLVGDGRKNQALKELTLHLGLRNVEFIPSVPKAEALWLTENSDIGYIGAQERPALYKYGVSPNKVFDYMLSSIPIIVAFQAKGDPVSAAGCGIVTPSGAPSDIAGALSSLLDMSADERRSLGAKGRSYVEIHHNYAEISSRIAAAIQDA